MRPLGRARAQLRPWPSARAPSRGARRPRHPNGCSSIVARTARPLADAPRSRVSPYTPSAWNCLKYLLNVLAAEYLGHLPRDQPQVLAAAAGALQFVDHRLHVGVDRVGQQAGVQRNQPRRDVVVGPALAARNKSGAGGGAAGRG